MKEVKTFLVGFVAVAIGVALFAGGVYIHSWLTSIPMGRSIIDVVMMIFLGVFAITLIYAMGRLVKEFLG